MYKNIFIFAGICLISALSCKNDTSAREATSTADYKKIAGETMGTSYHVTFASNLNYALKPEIDSLLVAINLEVSTYIDSSFISKFNHSENGLPVASANNHLIAPHFYINFLKSKDIYKQVGGAFDPTVMPLVNYWGFGYEPNRQVTAVDSALVDSLRASLVGMDKVKIVTHEDQSKSVVKENKNIELDFSALAKGYAVDAVGLLLEGKNINNYMVEIGGEVRARGKNARGKYWVIGINTPSEKADIADFKTRIRLKNRALATSGNYRNFYEVDGVKFSHTINPKTGYPVRSNLLSASVFADDCIIADALATACMVLGLEKSWTLIQQYPEIEAYFIFGKADGTMSARYTDGLKTELIE